jgi:hypothetical protein
MTTAQILAAAGVTADELGQVLRLRWEMWAREQPDVAEHPSWTRPWHEMGERERDVDREMAAGMFCAGFLAARG